MDEKHRHRPTKRLITLNTGGGGGGSLAKNRAKKFVVEDAYDIYSGQIFINSPLPSRCKTLSALR